MLPSIAPAVPDGDDQRKAHLALGRRHAGDRHDHFRRDRREDGLEEHQEADAEIARLLDQADRPSRSCAYAVRLASSRASIASHIRPGVSVPLNLSIATMPVGEVTLISVSHLPPMTSMPTNSSPRRLSSGPSAAQISRSVSVSSLASAVPPAARLERMSPFAGTAIDRAGDLAVDQNDPFVALGHFGKEGLQDVRLAVGGVEQLHQRGEVGAVACRP